MKYNKTIEFDSNDKPEIYSIRIAKLLNEQGLTQEDLAKLSGVSKSSITAWIFGDKNGKRTEPKILGLNGVAQALGVSVDYLIGNTDIKPLNLKLQAISNYTGLSQGAVDTLHHLNKTKCKTISQIIESKEFLNVVNTVISAQYNKDLLLPNGAPIINHFSNIFSDKNLSDNEKTADKIALEVAKSGLAPFYKQVVIENITTIFNELTESGEI